MSTTIKIREETRRTLRLIAALTDETMMEVMDRLARTELQRLQAEPADQENEWRRAPTQQR